MFIHKTFFQLSNEVGYWRERLSHWRPNPGPGRSRAKYTAMEILKDNKETVGQTQETHNKNDRHFRKIEQMEERQ